MLRKNLQIVQIITTSIITATLFSAFVNYILGNFYFNFYFELLWVFIMIPLIWTGKNKLSLYKMNQILYGHSFDHSFTYLVLLKLLYLAKGT